MGWRRSLEIKFVNSNHGKTINAIRRGGRRGVRKQRYKTAERLASSIEHGDCAQYPHHHQPITDGHPSARIMYISLRHAFHWPGLAQECYENVRHYPYCARESVKIRNTMVFK